MPDDYDTDDELEDETEGMQGLRKAKKAAEAEQRRLQDELAQAAADRRELAVIKAGLDMSNKTTQKFIEHYDGELSADALKAAAIDWGIIDDGTAETAQAAQGQVQMAAAVAGGESSPQGTTQVGPRHAAHQVPAEEAQMWSEFEKAVSGPFGAQAGLEVLQKYGRDAGGLDVDYEPGAGAPVTQPGTWQ